MSKSPVSVRSRSQCSRLNAAVAWRVTAGTGEMPLPDCPRSRPTGPRLEKDHRGKGCATTAHPRLPSPRGIDRIRWRRGALGDRAAGPQHPHRAARAIGGRWGEDHGIGRKTEPPDVDAIHWDPSVRKEVSAVSERTSKPWAKCLATDDIVGAPRHRQGTTTSEPAVAGHHSVRAGPRRSRHQ